MKKIFLSLAFVFVTHFVFSQNYKTGIGLRGGFFSGVTLKHFISETKAIECIIDSRWRGLQITGLYEIHKQAFEVEGLNWYYGFGAHVGFWDSYYVHSANTNNNYTTIGIDGILGIEYNFSEIPINISIDWKPAINIIGYDKFRGDGGALSIRYIF